VLAEFLPALIFSLLFHFAHHRFTQDPGARSGVFLSQPLPSTLVSYLWCVSGLPYWYDRLAVTLRHAGWRAVD